jgi:hypothetical protein
LAGENKCGEKIRQSAALAAVSTSGGPFAELQTNQYTVVCALLPFGCYELEVGKLKISPPLKQIGGKRHFRVD